HRADGVGRDLGCDPVRPVVADDADHVAAAEPELDHAEREITGAALIVVPGEFAPQPEILLAQRDLASVLHGVQAQNLGEGVGLGGATGIVDHAALSRTAGLSSGSTSASSSSPR